MESITKYAACVTDSNTIRYHLEKLYLAKNDRPGPVWIDVPLDVQAAEIDETSLVKFEPIKSHSKDKSDSLRLQL